jgi:hypothetical protein
MDIPTIIFVAGLCVVAFFVTTTVRREFRTQERQRREQELRSRPPHRKS